MLSGELFLGELLLGELLFVEVLLKELLIKETSFGEPILIELLLWRPTNVQEFFDGAHC